MIGLEIVILQRIAVLMEIIDELKYMYIERFFIKTLKILNLQ